MKTTVNRSNIVPGSAANRNNTNGKKVHPYVKNGFKGTPEIQETFERISKRQFIK